MELLATTWPSSVTMADPRRPALEIDRLHTEVAAQESKLKRRDDRIKYLEIKRSKLEKEVGGTQQQVLDTSVGVDMMQWNWVPYHYGYLVHSHY